MKSGKQGGADTSEFKMKPRPSSPPGIELDGHGHVIPLADRTDEDRAAAIAAGKPKQSAKDPEGDAESPASTPANQQGRKTRGSRPPDPEGRQGGQRR